MSDPDNFLRRWSRRKREAEAPSEKADTAVTQDAKAAEGNPQSDGAAPALPEFDVSKLPPIESISAETDITVFMQKGVPSALRHAALRRAWSADPAIRNFVGPNENFWDAAGPDGIPGFGDLDPNLDVKRLVAELFGEAPKDAKEPPPNVASDNENSADRPDERRTLVRRESPPADDNLVQRTENVAPQNNSEQMQPEKRLARRHGSAVPE